MNRLSFVLLLIFALLASGIAEAKKKKYPNGDYYEGEWKKGQPHGSGKMFYANGDVYVGNWVFGKIEGTGGMRYKNGDIYAGTWLNGKPNGNGTITFKNGNIVKGEWKDGNIIKGRLIDKQKNTFEGTFNNDWSIKEGKMILSNGDWYTGEWIKGKYFYNGDCKGNIGSTFFFAGKILNGAPFMGKGKGTLNGDTYDGKWINGDFTGHCIINNCNEQITKFDGQIEADGSHLGQVDFKDGSTYTGLLNQAYEKDGEGTLTLNHKNFSIKGTWRKDTLLQGNGSLSRGNRIYNYKVETNAISGKRVGIIYLGKKNIAQEELPYDYSAVSIVNRLTDAIILRERASSKANYEKYLKGKVFYINMPLNKYSEIFEVPLIGAALQRLFDKNTYISFTIIPLDENRLAYMQTPNFKNLRRSDRGYLIQQNMLMEKLTDMSIYNYTIVNDSLKFKSVASLALENCKFGNDKRLYGPNNRFVLSTYNSYEQLRKHVSANENTGFVFADIQDKLKNRTKSQNYFMTSEELKNKYKASSTDKKPSFPGGTDAMWKFIQANLKYPTICLENGIQGTVVLQFTVTRDGNINDIKVVQEVSPYLDKEAMRIIKLMPKWNPAIHEGQYIDATYTIPIPFKLD